MSTFLHVDLFHRSFSTTNIKCSIFANLASFASPLMPLLYVHDLTILNLPSSISQSIQSLKPSFSPLAQQHFRRLVQKWPPTFSMSYASEKPVAGICPSQKTPAPATKSNLPSKSHGRVGSLFQPLGRPRYISYVFLYQPDSAQCFTYSAVASAPSIFVYPFSESSLPMEPVP